LAWSITLGVPRGRLAPTLAAQKGDMLLPHHLTENNCDRRQTILFVITAPSILVLILVIAAAVKLISSDDLDMLITMPCSVACAIAIPIWTSKAKSQISSIYKSAICMLHAGLWFGLTYIFLEYRLISWELHSPGGVLFLLLPTGGIVIAAIGFLLSKIYFATTKAMQSKKGSQQVAEPDRKHVAQAGGIGEVD